MKRVLIAIASGVFVVSLNLLFTKPEHSPAWPSGDEIAHGIISLAVLIIALVVLVISFIALTKPDFKLTGILCIALCLPLPISVLCREVRKAKRNADLIKWRDWEMQAMEMTPLLIEYQSLHPDQFHYVSDKSEEVAVSGFPKFAHERDTQLPSRSTNGSIEILDPWGEPICYVMSRGDDEEIECRGLRQHIIFGGGGNEEAWNNPRGLGIARSKPSEVVGDGMIRQTIIVYMSVRFSRLDIADRIQMQKHKEEREAKARTN